MSAVRRFFLTFLPPVTVYLCKHREPVDACPWCAAEASANLKETAVTTDIIYYCDVHQAAAPYYQDGDKRGPKPRVCYPVLVNGDMPLDQCRVVERRMVDVEPSFAGSSQP